MWVLLHLCRFTQFCSALNEIFKIRNSIHLVSFPHDFSRNPPKPEWVPAVVNCIEGQDQITGVEF
jgi:hypothetical protein